MSCDWVKASITLYLYQELDEGEQNRLEEHTETCESCAQALQDERHFLQALNERPVAELSHTLLAECRHDLMRSVYREERAPSREGLMSWWPGVERVLASLWRPAWQPAAVTALLLVGFFGGRFSYQAGSPDRSGDTLQASLFPSGAAETALAGIQSVAVDPEQGNVQIVVEEVTRRTIIGQPQDPRIQALLLSAVRNYPNSGVRLDTLDILTKRAEDPDIRRTLLEAMLEDENPGIRLKALDALRAHTNNPDVRQALVRVLRQDENPGMRVHAIDLLTENPGRDLVGVFQDLMDREPNNYVRMQFRRTLQDLNASVERF